MLSPRSFSWEGWHGVKPARRCDELRVRVVDRLSRGVHRKWAGELTVAGMKGEKLFERPAEQL
jgi:hypothetical protein